MVVSAEIAGTTPRSATSVAAPRLTEALSVWALHAVFVVLTFVTYARVDPVELYHVSRGGLAGGAGRALVELNYPVALAAIPILGLCAAPLRRRAAAVGLVLCALVPFTVDQDDLDARLVNAAPAAGVAVAIALTVWALRNGGLGRGPAKLAGDGLRIAVAAVALLV